MDVMLRIKRFDPESEKPGSYFKEYGLAIDESATVLDGLIKIREDIDGTLALRCSCRSAICGSCAMRVNGKAMLACNTKITDAISGTETGVVVIEPAGNMEVIKDLVVDFLPFWNKIKAVQPWLQPEGEPPEHEYVAPNEDMLELAGVMACIMCGACVSDCTVLEVDSNFLGPAALAKAFRFVDDPRDDASAQRLGELNEYGGAWDCTRCMQCVEVCPKNVDPMGRIMTIRDRVMDQGYTDTYGARHAIFFSEDIKKIGRVDELRLPIMSKGLFNIKELFKLIPLGIRSQLNGKRPPIFPKKNPNQENVRRLFEKSEEH